MSAKWKKKIDRFNEVERQIDIQENRLLVCSEEMISTHAYLLQRLTDEWCNLLNEIPPEIMYEAKIA